jgi:hypothetical protein
MLRRDKCYRGRTNKQDGGKNIEDGGKEIKVRNFVKELPLNFQRALQSKAMEVFVT